MEGLRILTAADIRSVLPMADAIAAMRDAFALLARGDADMPARTAIRLPPHGATMLVMPGQVPGRFGLGAKLVSVFPRNAAGERPVVQGAMVVFDGETGAPAAVLDGAALTALRTGAASGLATDLLARPDARRLAIIGAGAQARTQLEAVCTVRPIAEVRVWSRTPDRARRLVEETAGRAAMPAAVSVAATPRAAVDGAHVICMATAATDPVLSAADVGDSAHVNAIGSFTPAMREFEPALLRDAFTVVDSRAAAAAEAGEVISAVRAGWLRWDQIVELGELVTESVREHRAHYRVSVFKSVGLAVQDLVAAARIVDGVWRAGFPVPNFQGRRL